MTTTDSPDDDREALVRFDLAATARRAGYSGSAILAGIATTEAHWLAVAADLRRARTRHGSGIPGLVAASEAAEALSRGDLSAALTLLGDACGVSPSQWCEITRDERAAEAS